MRGSKKARFKQLMFLLLLATLFLPQAATYSQEDKWISLLANVSTLDLKRIPNLRLNNFRVVLKHELINVTAVRSERPRHIVMVLDASASMTEPRRGWDLVIKAARDFASSVPIDCSLGLIIFGRHILQEIPPGEDRQKIDGILQDMVSGLASKRHGTSTALYDAIERATILLSPVVPGDAIFVITDGEDSTSKQSLNRLRASLRQKQIRVFQLLLYPVTYHFNHSMHFVIESPSLTFSQQLILQLSEDTGGYCYVLPPASIWNGRGDPEFYQLDSAELDSFYMNLHTLNDLIFQFYRLDLDPELFSAKKTAKLALEILNTNGQPVKGLRLFYNSRPCISQYLPTAP